MKVRFVPKSGMPVLEISKYVIVRSDCFNTEEVNRATIVMGMEYPHFIGRIFKTTNIERWESFISNQQYNGATLRDYMIGINIIGSVDEYERSISENKAELTSRAIEMIDFYKNEVIDKTKPSVFSRYKLKG